MNAHVESFFRPTGANTSWTWDSGAWVGAFVAALVAATVASIALPGILVLPAVALGLFTASLLPVLAVRRSSALIRERARLFAAMLFAIGVGAAALSDLNAVATFLG